MSTYGNGYPTTYGSYNPDSPGLTVQNGFEGYLLPVIQKQSGTKDGIQVEETPSWSSAILGSLGSTLGFGDTTGYGVKEDNSEDIGGGLTALGSPLGGLFNDYNNAYGIVDYDDSFGESKFLTLLKALLPFPKTVAVLLFKAASVIFSSASIIAVAGFITFLICKFTSVCSLSLAGLTLPFLNWSKNLTKDVTETIAGVDLTADRVKRAGEFVKNAIEKYQQLQSTINQVTNPVAEIEEQVDTAANELARKSK